MEYRTMNGESEFVVVSAAERMERDKIVQMERHYFLVAQRNAAKAWSESGNSLKYPGHSFRPPETKKISHHVRENDANKKCDKAIAIHARQIEIRERNEEMKKKAEEQRNRYNRRPKTDKDIYARQRATLDEAYPMLLDEMDKLMAGSAAPGARTPRPEDVGGFGQPKR